MMHQLLYRINNERLTSKTLPFELTDYLELMDLDESKGLEASLGLLYYHILLVNEKDPKIKLPTLLSKNLIEGVQACRNIDKCFINGDKEGL